VDQITVNEELVEGEGAVPEPVGQSVTLAAGAVLGERAPQTAVSRKRFIVDYESSDAESVSSEVRRNASRQLSSRECTNSGNYIVISARSII
jgi:hypothetical protein